MMDCILIRLLLVDCCSVMPSAGDSSRLQRRDCTDSRKSVCRLFLSASASKHPGQTAQVSEVSSSAEAWHSTHPEDIRESRSIENPICGLC